MRFTTRYVSMVKLSIDWSKTWQWCTQGSSRKLVKAQLKSVHPHRNIQIVQTARDLGYILHYGRMHSRTTQRERHQKALSKLARLRKKKAPLQARAQICRHALGQALYATETYVVGRAWVQELRSHLARTLSPNRRNTNPYLALALLSEHVIDPEIFLIEQSIKSCRQLLHVLPTQERKAYFHIASRHSAEPLQVHGPAGALAYNLAQIGWSVDKNAHLLTDTAIEFNLLDENLHTIRAFLRTQFVQHFLQTRVIKPKLRHIPPPDAPLTIGILKEFPPSEANFVLSSHGGKHASQPDEAFH